tara:strand:- start:1212 stop:1364 length:153 start_codon:yes stop_codon:yes gene_type:complete
VQSAQSALSVLPNELDELKHCVAQAGPANIFRPQKFPQPVLSAVQAELFA